MKAKRKRYYGTVEAILPELAGKVWGPNMLDYVTNNAPDVPSATGTVNEGTVVNTFVLHRVLIYLDGNGRIESVTQERWNCE